MLIRKRKDWHFPRCLIFTWLRVTDLEGAAGWELGQNLGMVPAQRFRKANMPIS